MACRIGRDADRRDGVRGIVINCLDLRESREMVGLAIERGLLIGVGGCIPDARSAYVCHLRNHTFIPDSYTVLNQPLVDGLGGMGHEDSSLEVGLGHDIRQRSRMVEMETASESISKVIRQTCTSFRRPWSNGQNISPSIGSSCLGEYREVICLRGSTVKGVLIHELY